MGNAILRMILCALAVLMLDVAVCAAADVAEVPFERLNLRLSPVTGQPDFVVARTDEEFGKMQEVYGSRAQPYKPEPPPVIDFKKRVVIAYFFASSPYEPYNIRRIVEYPDVVTMEINHTVQGTNCVCHMSSLLGVMAVSIPRVDKPIRYEIKPNKGLTCTKPAVSP